MQINHFTGILFILSLDFISSDDVIGRHNREMLSFNKYKKLKLFTGRFVTYRDSVKKIIFYEM